MRKTTHQFVSESSVIHDNKYDYSLVEYVNNATKVKIKCPVHGVFLQTPLGHTKSGCPKCAILQRHETNLTRYGSLRKPQSESSREKQRRTNIERYGTEWVSQSTLVKSKKRDTVIERYGVSHISQCQDIIDRKERNNVVKYGVKYPKQQHMKLVLPWLENVEWLTDQYTSKRKTSAQIAEELEVERTTILNYLKSHGISINRYYPQSKKCIVWLGMIAMRDNIKIQHAYNQGEFQIPTTLYSVDGFCKDTNTVYEFYGDYWHGNPERFESFIVHQIKHKTMHDLFEETKLREQHIKDLGYNVVSIWENEFDRLCALKYDI